MIAPFETYFLEGFFALLVYNAENKVFAHVFNGFEEDVTQLMNLLILIKLKNE